MGRYTCKQQVTTIWLYVCVQLTGRTSHAPTRCAVLYILYKAWMRGAVSVMTQGESSFKWPPETSMKFEQFIRMAEWHVPGNSLRAWNVYMTLAFEPGKYIAQIYTPLFSWVHSFYQIPYTIKQIPWLTGVTAILLIQCCVHQIYNWTTGCSQCSVDV